MRRLCRELFLVSKMKYDDKRGFGRYPRGGVEGGITRGFQQTKLSKIGLSGAKLWTGSEAL